jgi:protein-S-isoprenylcysteine O-methyltransferase Ste14
MKIISIFVVVFSYILIFFAPVYGLQKAKKKHNVNLKDVKNEIKNGYVLRVICSLVYYFALVDWIFSFNLIPWAYIPYLRIINIIGLVLAGITTFYFWWIHITLGANYHGPLKLHDNHELIIHGPYAISRHPTYVAFPLFHITLALITMNYLILISGCLMSIYVNSIRIKVEEKLLIERFGELYIEYSKRVGKYFIKRIN